jgi:hypothetical protein
MTASTWQEHWPAFVDEVSKLLRRGESSETLATIFGGRTVRWRGTVFRMKLDEVAPGVDLDLPEIHVDLGHGRSVVLNGLYLPISDTSAEDWSKSQPGDKVLFEATFLSGPNPFPPIELHTFSTGRTILSIQVTNGKLIERQD